MISLPEPENPYKGLRAFQSADVHDFFGRETLTQKLIDRMNEAHQFGRFLAVVGPSGSGKSSVVKAGLIPALWRGELPGSERWFVVDMIPGAHPLDELETALIRVAANQASNLNEQLKRDERGLLRVANIILPQDDTELVIVVDQFEEVFTLVEDETERRHFLNLLLTAVTDSRSRVRIIVTLRADYYDRPLHYPDFGEMVRQRMETVLPLGAKDLERAIRGPADRAGVTFEAGLVEQIVSEMTYQSGALPLLQYALTELFDRREGRLLTHAAYQDIGGAVGALANRADEIFHSLTDEAQRLTHQMFLRLVTLGEGAEDTRRRADQSELLSLTDDTDLMEEIIDTFAAYRLLSLDSDPTTREPTVEVAHEAILREWEHLRDWLNESRSEIRLQRQLAHAAVEWQNAGQDASFLLRGSRLEVFEKWGAETQLALTPKERDYLSASIKVREQENQDERVRQAREAKLEQRSRRFLRGLVAVLAIATLGALALTGFALSQRNTAQRNEREARSLALAASAQLALNEGNITQAITLAEDALEIADSDLARRVLGQAAFAPQTTRIFQETTGIAPVVLSPQETDLKFALIAHMPAEGFPFSEVMFKGMQDACEQLRITCQWFGGWAFTGWDDILGIWDEGLAWNPDAIGTTTLTQSDEIRGRAEQATEQGIPLVVFNIARGLDPTPTEQALLYIGTDEFISGESNARRVFTEARGDGVTITRGVCFRQVLGSGDALEARCGGVESVFDEEGVALDQIFLGDEEGVEEEPPIEAQKIAEYFAAHPNTNAVFMLGPQPAASLNLYIQQAGIEPGEFYATTHDTSPEIFQMIRDGYLLQTIDQQPYMQGFQTIVSLYLYRRYGIRPSGFINTSSVVDQSNVEYVVQLAELGYR